VADDGGLGDNALLLEALWGYAAGIFPSIKRFLLRNLTFKKDATKVGGSIEIKSPQNRETIDLQPWVPVKGTARDVGARLFWLLTRDGDKYWPQTRISVQHDGQWEGRVRVSRNEKTRQHSVTLAEVSGFANSVFEDWRSKGHRTNDWGPLTFKADGSAFKLAQEIVISVKGLEEGGKSNE